MKALLLSIALALGANGAQGATMPPWNTILGPPQGKVPGPASFRVTWRTNLPAATAMEYRKRKNRCERMSSWELLGSFAWVVASHGFVAHGERDEVTRSPDEFLRIFLN